MTPHSCRIRSTRLPRPGFWVLLAPLFSALLASESPADTAFEGWTLFHDGSFESSVTWGPLMSPLPPGTGGAFAQRHWVSGIADSIALQVRALADGPLPTTATVDVYLWSDASGLPGTLVASRLAQVLPLPVVPDPLGEGWRLQVGLIVPVTVTTPWVGVRIRASGGGAATLALRTDLDGANTTAPLTNAPPGAPFGSGWQPVSTNFGPLAALAVEARMRGLRVAGPPSRGAGGDGDFGVTAGGTWRFERFDEPPLLAGCFSREDSVGNSPDAGGWTLAAGAAISAGVMPAAIVGETDSVRASADVEGHAMWFYDPLTEGFPAGHRGLFETPELNRVDLEIDGGPLAYRFLSLSTPDLVPSDSVLRWLVGSRSRGIGGDWGPWFDVSAALQPGADFHLVPVFAQGNLFQIRFGIVNPGPVPIGKKVAKGDAPQAKKVITGPPVGYKEVPQLSQKEHKHTCMVMATAACLAYWAQNGYFALRDSSNTTAKKNKNMADSLARIMEKPALPPGDKNKEGLGTDGIDEWLKRRGVHEDTPGPPPLKKLIHEDFRDSSASWSRIRDHLRRGHDVLLGIKAYKIVNGNRVAIPGTDGDWAHMVTVAEITDDNPNGTKSIRVSDPNGNTIQDEKVADPKKKDSTYPATGVKVNPPEKEVVIPAGWKKKGEAGDVIEYVVEEVHVVRPEPPNPAPGAVPGAEPPARSFVAIERDPVMGASPEGFPVPWEWSITAPPDRSLSYVAVHVRVPYEDVISPPGWTWEPLPSMPPGGTGCESLISPLGIAWRSQGADIAPGATLSGFGFSVASIYPSRTDELLWRSISPTFHGVGSFTDGPGEVEPTTSVPGPRPATLAMFGAIPTPSRGGVQVLFSSPITARARAIWVDAQGRQHASREFGVEPGLNRLDWNGQGVDGRRVPPGVYFCRIEGENEPLVAKVVLTGR